MNGLDTGKSVKRKYIEPFQVFAVKTAQEQ
jgi:hypothetical protein